jgi:UDP-2-acetamido-3-amino-2,3-dideoxy-glucuronate N-acetyltransferase
MNNINSNENFFSHESCYIEKNVKIGNGTKIWHFSHVQSGARIGRNCSIGQNVNIGNNVQIANHVKIQNNVSVYEGVELEDYVFCGPSMVFTNIKVPRSEFPQKGTEYYVKTLVKKSATIGANATILCGVIIGEYAFIGSGAVVTKDVPAHALIIGNPGRVSGWVDKRGQQVIFDDTNISKCGKYRIENNILIINSSK